jgi:hypothetical protein
MSYYNFDKLEDLKDGDILFFDELLNGNPVVLNACLTILEQRTLISGKPLPNIMICAAANPQGMVPITPQIKERFVWYTTVFDEEMWSDYMFKKYKTTIVINQKLSKLIKDETFKNNNFCTPRSLDKAVNMTIHDLPSPYSYIKESILNEMIHNPFDEKVDLGDGKFLEVDEMIKWIDLIKLTKTIK